MNATLAHPATAAATDRIERSIHIKAARSRVWKALSEPKAYGEWFGATLEGATFAPGQHVRGPITICGHEHVMFDALIERVEPETLLSYRWHPYAVDTSVDYSSEPRTTVTFTLADVDGGTQLTVVEAGFDRLPPERRITALQMNDRGWAAQLKNIDRHVVAG